MSQFVHICSQSELPAEGEAAEFNVQNRILCVAKVNGAVSVLDGVCPHEGGPLGEGIIEGGRVVCPWHAYAYDLHTGLTENDPDLKVEVIDSKIENGELSAKL